VTAFLIFAFCDLVKTEEPVGNENELVTVSFSLAVATELADNAESVMAILDTKTVTRRENLRTLRITFNLKRNGKVNEIYLQHSQSYLNYSSDVE
jgi:hypothetical protein